MRDGRSLSCTPGSRDISLLPLILIALATSLEAMARARESNSGNKILVENILTITCSYNITADIRVVTKAHLWS